MVTATTYFFYRSPSRYSSLPQVENRSEQPVLDLQSFAHPFGSKTSRWLPFATLCVIGVVSCLAILFNNPSITTPVTAASGVLFLTAQTITYLLLPQVLNTQQISSQGELEDTRLLDWHRLSELSGWVFGLWTIYLALSSDPFFWSPTILSSTAHFVIQWMSIILMVSSSLRLGLEHELTLFLLSVVQYLRSRLLQ
jgi:hypothetical protein